MITGLLFRGDFSNKENKMQKQNNEIMKFNFNKKEVRTITNDDNTWWVAKDICNVLDYVNSRQVIKNN